MKKIFMASLVAMMAVTAANADIASTDYVMSRTGNVSSLEIIKDIENKTLTGAVERLAGRQQLIAGLAESNTSRIEGLTSSKADKATTYTKDEADAEFLNEAEVDAAIASKTSADIAGKQLKSTADYQLGNSNGGWTTMTDEQKKALNSGVTAAIVNQVATNKTDIATNKTDIATLQTSKLSVDQGVNNAGKAVVVDSNGNLKVGQIDGDAIGDGSIPGGKLDADTKVMLGNGQWAYDTIKDLNATATGDGTVVKSVAQTEGKVTATLGYIGTADIEDNAVTTAKILNGNVTTAKIEDSAVTTEKIARGAVTTDKIQDRAVGGAKIADSGVVTRNIADDAIVTSKILDANVTKAKLDTTVQATLDKADNAMQETGLKALPSWEAQKCGDTNVTCSLVSKSGVIAWEAVSY